MVRVSGSVPPRKHAQWEALCKTSGWIPTFCRVATCWPAGTASWRGAVSYSIQTLAKNRATSCHGFAASLGSRTALLIETA
jgi:hypothetical protein